MPAENAAMERKVHPKIWTYENIAAMKAQLKSMGLSLDWSREIATCDPAYYKHQQKMFLDFLARRSGRAAEVEGELGSGRSDRARQRAGDRRPRLALRRHGRAARADAMVLQDHRLFAGAARRARHARPLAGKSPADAEELDRPLGGLAGPLRARCEDAHRTAKASSRSSPRGRTRLFGAKFMAVAPDHPLAAAAAKKNPKLAAFIDECRHRGTAQADIDTAEKLGFDTGITRAASVRSELEAAGLCRELHFDGLRHRRHFRLPGARPARPRFRQQIRARQHAGGLPARAVDPKSFVITDTAYDGDGRLINSRFLDGMTTARSEGRSGAHGWRRKAAGNRPVAQRQVNFRLRDWGISRQRYWGCPIPDHSLRGVRRRAGAGKTICR